MRLSPARILPVLALAVFATTAATAQVIEVSPLTHDFGDMKQQQTRNLEVTVTNNGAAMLVIENVEADCGCTVPTLQKHSLGPGESTVIDVEFSSKKFNGKVIKGVHIDSNDPLNPRVSVMLTANVHTPLIIDPVNQRLGFSQSLAGETVTRRATFTATGDEPLEISVERARKDLFDVKVVNNLDGNPQMAALEVTVPADMPAGRQRDNVRVATNVPEFPTVDFEMQAWVVEEITASPARLSYRFKKDLRQSIRIAPFRKGTEFKVLKAESDLPELNLEVIETIPNEEVKILVSGKPVGKDDPRAIESRGRMSGTIRVHTNLKSTPVIEIPVTYMVRM